MLNKKKLKSMCTFNICIIYHEIMSKIYMGFILLSYVNGISNQYSEIKFRFACDEKFISQRSVPLPPILAAGIVTAVYRLFPSAARFFL